MEMITATGTTVTTGYIEVLPLTFDEKVRMYMRCSKLELARMLAERDRVYDLFQPQPYVHPYTYPNPYDPLNPIIVTCQNNENCSYSCSFEENEEYTQTFSK